MPHEVPTVRVENVPGDAVVLDVREPDEWAAGHIAGAMHVPMNQVPTRLAYDPGPLADPAQIVVVCKVGGRSAQVTAWLRGQGVDAVNLVGGMVAWERTGRPMEADGDARPRVV